ncbi:MAG: tRNA (adenosine(37)-N6)-threonylcarbamoyltransferase complex dimerization subunit type 1 TsaB [Pyrinomonadaceae bacterium]|nr:tRNA (adenosine(37)-N6)-threonylcarbamoyltransferase complex dimerization subunit type 1 TsaB [Pyrinomonadaceae bacterium]
MKHLPLILSIDTATLGGSVCLARGDAVLATRIGDPTVSHSNSLLKDINECLDQAGVSLRNVDLLAAASGPGSFTGLRIGLATVKALAATLRISCVGIPTLHAVAHAAGSSNATVALLPAGRGEVFIQLLSVSPDGSVIPLDEPAHLSPSRVFDKYGSLKTLKWSGPAAHLYRDTLESYAQEKGIDFDGERPRETKLSQGWTLTPAQGNLTPHVAALALQKYDSNEVCDALSLSAIYVRPSDAELKCP